MKASTSLVALLSLTPAVSALSWPRWLPELDTLVVRQNNQDSSSPAPTSAPSTRQNNNNDNSNSESQTQSVTGPLKPITTNLNTAGRTQSGGPTGSTATGNSTRTSPPRKTQFNLQDPAGGVVMVTPAITAGSQLYKIGDYVTWGWNYTNLQGNPTAVDVLVSCSKATKTWTLTQNMSFTESGNHFTWDTGAYQQTAIASPLLTDQYTLIIYDSDSSISATPEPGYLAPFFNQFIFGMYESKPYTPSNEGWQCASCSGANGLGVDRKAMGAAVVMSAVTVLSFTWFVVGLGGVF